MQKYILFRVAKKVFKRFNNDKMLISFFDFYVLSILSPQKTLRLQAEQCVPIHNKSN